MVHGHFLVNDKKVNIPSYQVKKGEIISLRSRSYKVPIVKKGLSEKNPLLPSWLERKGPVGKVTGEPQREDIRADINEQLIVEYYSR